MKTNNNECEQSVINGVSTSVVHSGQGVLVREIHLDSLATVEPEKKTILMLDETPARPLQFCWRKYSGSLISNLDRVLYATDVETVRARNELNLRALKLLPGECWALRLILIGGCKMPRGKRRG